MIKHVGLYKRPSSMTIEEYRKFWLGSHADIGKRWPGIKKYKISFDVSPVDEKHICDSMAELYFESMEDLIIAWASPEHQEGMKHLAEYNIQVVGKTWVEENVII